MVGQFHAHFSLAGREGAGRAEESGDNIFEFDDFRTGTVEKMAGKEAHDGANLIHRAGH